jgi:hypothetical protein
MRKINEDLTSIYMKIITNYYQILSSIGSFNLDFPIAFLQIPNFLSTGMTNLMDSIDCFLSSQFYREGRNT